MKSKLSKLIDFIFGIKKNTAILIAIFFVALILRVIAAINLSVTADDMHHVLHAINFLDSGRLITYDQSSGLWHLFTNLFYNIFGIGQVTSRIAPILFGSFTVLVIYLISREFFDEKVSIIAALLAAISPFLVKNTFGEMDVMAMFFVMSSMYFFVKAIKKDNMPYGNFVISGVFIGLAMYTKVYPVLFIPSMITYFCIFSKSKGIKIITKKNLKILVLFLAVAGLFAIPAITHNYLLYKDKGFMDLQFTRTFELGREKAAEYYSWDPIFHSSNSWKGLIFGDRDYHSSGIPLILIVFDYLRKGDPLVFYLAILAIFLIVLNKKQKLDYLYLSLSSIFFASVFLGSIILLSKHFIFLDLFFIPLAAFSLNEIREKITAKNKIFGILFILGIIIIQFILFGSPKAGVQPFYDKSAVSQAVEFKNDLPKDSLSLLVFDGRIYTGTGYWISNGKPMLDGTNFMSLVSQQQNMSGRTINVDLYYLECVQDDCGWGIEQSRGINNSMESLTNLFKDKGELVKVISESDRSKLNSPFIDNKIDIYNIYLLKAQLKEEIVIFAAQPKKWFLYDIGYEPKNAQFDYYKTEGFIDFSINSIAKIISRLALILALISLFFVAYRALKR